MDAAHGSTAIAVTALSRGIREYSLYQAVRLVLERLREQHPQLDEHSLYQRLEFQANPSLGFPGADIEQVTFFHEHGELRARLQVNLPGLFGSGSPLPAFYMEQALGEDNPTRDFLDLFNERLYRLLLPIWEKYRYYARFRPGATDPFSARLFALIGLGGEPIRASSELNWKRLLPYLGLLSLRAHSAALIESVLRYYFKHPAVHIEQCLERRVNILAEQQSRLGQANSRLGSDLVLGDSVRDRGGKFRIHIHQLSWERFHEFLPNGPHYAPLLALVRFTLRDPLDYDIRLELQADNRPQLGLGAHNPCRLGWTSWLGQPRAAAVVTLSNGSSQG
ncbi:MAG TPA: type VI secretion system baseplate subunit TssG [Pseudomonas sp.]|nr:type VI secretion system baseplate subunit TssG [Pseudomonas sp.]